MSSARTILARDSATTTYLSRGESLGLLVDTLAGLASTLASGFVLYRILRRIWKNGWTSLGALHISVTALFVAEVIQGTGQAMNLKWVIEGESYTGGFCTAQAMLSQLGEPYVALATLTIAVQTFFILWRVKHLGRIISACIMGIEFLFVVLFAAIAFGVNTHSGSTYYVAPVPYWCWVGNNFPEERIFGEYIWFWSALLASIALYIPLFLLYFGVIQRGTRWYMPQTGTSTLSIPRHDTSSRNSQHWSHGARGLPASRGSVAGASTDVRGIASPSQEHSKALSTILYPIVYCFLILPLSIVRWVDWSTTKPRPRWPALIVISIFSLSGVVNSFLYLQTRKRLFQRDEQSDPPAPSIKLTQFPVTN